ncbi:hypothetical protein HY375_01115 [Candidatus Berkelbacteria bacterium]|nr:hypothetical protein [Candidatus Berkelbacteria bacterium]
MAYADVVLDHPSPGPLTYRLTPEVAGTAVLGSLVEVPLGRRTVPGVISGFRRRSPGAGLRFRSITRVLTDAAWAPPATLRLAKKVADYSLQPLGSCLFRLLPPAGKRSMAAPGSTPPNRGLRPERIHLYGSARSRWEQYVTLAARALTAGQQVLIIAPHASHTEILTGLRSISDRASVLTPGTPPGQQRTLAQALATGTCPVLIATRQAVGWPAHHLGVTIVDDVMHQSHTDDQRPYLDSATIALLRSQLGEGHVILGSTLPTFGMALSEHRGLAKRRLVGQREARVTLVAPSGKDGLSERARALLGSGTAAAPVGLIAPTQGLGGDLTCLACGHVVLCTACGGRLDLRRGVASAQCLTCQASEILPAACPQCQSHQLSVHGRGVQSLTEALTRQSGPLPSVEVGTEQLVEAHPHFRALIFVSGDSPLASPDLDRALRFLGRVKEASARAEELVIQTHQPDNPHWALLKSSPWAALDHLLAERARLNVPPYRRTLLLWGPADRAPALPPSLGAIQQTLDHQGRAMIELLVPPRHWTATWQTVQSLLPATWRYRVDSLLDWSA